MRGKGVRVGKMVHARGCMLAAGIIAGTGRERRRATAGATIADGSVREVIALQRGAARSRYHHAECILANGGLSVFFLPKWNQRRYLCSLKSAPVPTCKYYPRARTVYVYCNGKPVKKWGIGPEGRSQATRNCYHAYHNHRRGGLKFCKGK